MFYNNKFQYVEQLDKLDFTEQQWKLRLLLPTFEGGGDAEIGVKKVPEKVSTKSE